MTATGPDLCLVSPERGSAFITELLEVVADTVRRVGGRARTAVGRFPEPEHDTVYVVVPHEYLVLTPDADYPSPELCARTIGFSVEHPGTDTFERNAGLVGSLAAAVDIDVDSAAEMARRGVESMPYQLGYTPLWDAWGGDPDSARDIDVTYLGTAERRRSQLLGSYAPELEHLRCRLLTPPHEMMHSARVDFLVGRAKYEHLARSRFLINLHRERKQALEWVRTIEALCNGTVVVSELSTAVEPMVPGEHLLLARPDALGSVVAGLAADPDRERAIRVAGYDLVRRLDSSGSARELVKLAGEILDGRAALGTTEHAAARSFAGALRSPEDALAVDTPSWDRRFAGERSLPGAPNPAAASRAAQRLVSARRRAGRTWVDGPREPLFPDAPRVDVDVLVVRAPGEVDPDDLAGDLLTGTVLPRRVLVCEDGVLPSGKSRAWDVLAHPEQTGRGFSRNRLLERSSADWLLVLDGGMRASRHLLERLWDGRGDAVVAHCPVADPVEGVVGALPAEARRLAVLPYLGSGYLVRRDVVAALGGWAEDPRASGLEDHVFWRAVTGAGMSSALVQQVLLRREVAEPAARPVDLNPAAVWALVDTLAAAPIPTRA